MFTVSGNKGEGVSQESHSDTGSLQDQRAGKAVVLASKNREPRPGLQGGG